MNFIISGPFKCARDSTLKGILSPDHKPCQNKIFDILAVLKKRSETGQKKRISFRKYLKNPNLTRNMGHPGFLVSVPPGPRRCRLSVVKGQNGLDRPRKDAVLAVLQVRAQQGTAAGRAARQEAVSHSLLIWIFLPPAPGRSPVIRERGRTGDLSAVRDPCPRLAVFPLHILNLSKEF